MGLAPVAPINLSVKFDFRLFIYSITYVKPIFLSYIVHRYLAKKIKIDPMINKKLVLTVPNFKYHVKAIVQFRPMYYFSFMINPCYKIPYNVITAFKYIVD